MDKLEHMDSFDLETLTFLDCYVFQLELKQVKPEMELAFGLREEGLNFYLSYHFLNGYVYNWWAYHWTRILYLMVSPGSCIF